MPTQPDRQDPVRKAVRAYAAMLPELEAATVRFVELITDELDEAGINYLSVDGRTKSVASFAGKVERLVGGERHRSHREGERPQLDPLAEITDQIGVRVITYVRDDVTAVADLLAEALAVLDDRDMGQETASEGRFGYASRHLLVAVDASRTVPSEYESLRRRAASVQIRTVLQHAWAQFEHDTRYKGSVPAEYASDLDRRFTLAAGLIELADQEFSAIRDRLHAPAQGDRPDTDDADTHRDRQADPQADPRIDTRQLANFLAAQYVDAGWSRTEHYAWISGLLLELGVTSVDELAALLAAVDSAEINRRMAYKYPPGAVRRLDDALLALFGERYVGLHGNAHRTEPLRARLETLRARTG